MPSKQIDTGTDNLLASQRGAVLTLTMNRPDSLNALTLEMAEALATRLNYAEADDSVRCIVLTGSDKAFCAGGDISGLTRDAEAASSSPEAIISRQRDLHHAIAGKLHHMPKPTLAAINGVAAGAGFSLALACDLRIVANSAIMTTSFANVGLSGDFGGTYFLTQLVGSGKAKELYFTSSRLTAFDAQALGLANRIVNDKKFASEVADFTHTLATGPTIAFAYMKKNINAAAITSLEMCMDMEADHLLHCFQTTDYQEGIASFIDKKQPIFRGC